MPRWIGAALESNAVRMPVRVSMRLAGVCQYQAEESQGVFIELSAAPATAADACALLSVAEIRNITGRQDYPEGDQGDPPGQGVGGGSSCQYGGATFMPGDHPPLLGIVLIPATGGKSWTEGRQAVKLYEGCKREPLSGVGDLAFAELCPRDRGPRVYVKAGAHDVIVQIDAEPPATAASVKPTVVAVAKAAAAKLR